MWTPDPSTIITAAQKQAEADAAKRLSDFPNLEPDQFWFIVRVSGYETALKDWMVSLAETDPVAWAAASSKLEYAKFFERDHPFVEMAAEAIEIDPVELDALWQYGAAS